MNLNYDLIPMLLNLETTLNSDLTLNIDTDSLKSEFGSNLPVASISKLTYDFLNNVGTEDLTVTYTSQEDSLVSNLSSSDLATTHTVVYLVMASVLAESIAIYYFMENDKTEFNNITSNKIKQIRTNINILCDWFGDYNKYWVFIEDLRTMNISLGYIQNQISFLVNNINFRLN